MTFLEQILVSIIAAFATALLAYFGFWRQAKAELQKEFESRFNEKKWDTYLRFLRQKDVLDEGTLDDLKELKLIESEILLIGSNEVVKSFIKWRDKSTIYSFDDKFVVTLYLNTINAMREDLGKKQSNLNILDFAGYLFYDSEEEST